VRSNSGSGSSSCGAAPNNSRFRAGRAYQGVAARS
jgi:hypothetical protein